MSRYLADLEAVLGQLLVEHQRLIGHLDLQQKAMQTFDTKAMTESASQQESCRLRITGLEHRRRVALANLARELRVTEPLTLRRIAALLPPREPHLMKLRSDLQTTVDAVRSRTAISGRLAGAVLGHLNTVFRLFAGAAGRAGLYTKSGIPRVSGRIGVMEAIG